MKGHKYPYIYYNKSCHFAMRNSYINRKIIHILMDLQLFLRKNQDSYPQKYDWHLVESLLGHALEGIL